MRLPIDRSPDCVEDASMGVATVLVQEVHPCVSACRLVVRREAGLSEISEFAIAGLQIGQQVVAMAGPSCLKDIAASLSQAGLRPDAALRSGRLVFLTAPDCFCQLTKPEHPLQRGALRCNGPLLRWVSDWSWAYTNGFSADALRHQRLATTSCGRSARCRSARRTATKWSGVRCWPCWPITAALPGREGIPRLLASNQRLFLGLLKVPICRG